MRELRVTTRGVKICGLALVLVVGCHDASKDLERLAEQCTKTCLEDKDHKLATPEAKKACASQAVDDLVAYIKANPNPRGNEQNAAAQFKALATCASSLGVDVNGKTKGL